MRRSHLPVAALAVWTLFVWGNRLWLAWTEADRSVGDKVVATLPLVAFVGFAVATLWLLTRWSGAGSRPPLATLTTAFAGFTVVYWAVRLPMIVAHDHPGPFKVVHAALALISVGLAVAAFRAVAHLRRMASGSPPPVAAGR